MNLPEKIKTLESWYEAIWSGNAELAARQLSPCFGIHEGLTADGFVTGEISNINANRFRANGLSIRFELRKLHNTGEYLSQVSTIDGRFLNNDYWHFDDRSLIKGNGRSIEMVSKLHFASGSPPAHHVAIRSQKPGQQIVSVVPSGEVASIQLINPSCQQKDRFQLVRIEFQSTPPDSIRLRIGFSTGNPVTETCHLYQWRQPGNHSELYPKFSEGVVVVPKMPIRAWSLSVVFLDGSFSVIEAPTAGIYRFDKTIRSCVLTDALDNDWEGANV